MNQRQLLILRHGAAEDGFGMADRDRDLTSGGETDVRRVAGELSSMQLAPEAVLVSPAKRTRRTAALVAETLELGANLTTIEPRIYNADVDDLLQALAGLDPPLFRVLLVGHNPGVSELIESLTGARVSVRSGMLHVLQTRSPWSEIGPAEATIAAVIDPRALESA